jgi:hypothetical protein
MIRAGYGAALVLVPGPAIYLATGSRPGPRTRRTAQLLGARHLIQTALTAVRPDPGMFTLGGQVDAVHAASMLLLAGISGPARRAALADALAETAFSAAGFSVSIRAKLLARAWVSAAGPLN